MPRIVDSGRMERETLTEFLRKHLPVQWYTDEVKGRGEGVIAGRQLLAIKYFFEPVSGEDVEAAVIQLSQSTAIEVDRSFLEDFTELAAKYERYNPNVTVTVIVREPKDE
jgi:hypothetical protein